MLQIYNEMNETYSNWCGNRCRGSLLTIINIPSEYGGWIIDTYGSRSGFSLKVSFHLRESQLLPVRLVHLIFEDDILHFHTTLKISFRSAAAFASAVALIVASSLLAIECMFTEIDILVRHDLERNWLSILVLHVANLLELAAVHTLEINCHLKVKDFCVLLLEEGNNVIEIMSLTQTFSNGKLLQVTIGNTTGALEGCFAYEWESASISLENGCNGAYET